MCTVCGCGTGDVRIEGQVAGTHRHGHDHVHRHADGTVHDHSHSHDHLHDHMHDHLHDHSHGHAHDHHHSHDVHHSHDHGHSHDGPAVRHDMPTRLIAVEQDILSRNDALAAENRALLASRGILALNLVSSPGSGKTTLLVETLKLLTGRLPVAVIEGDQETSNDADRIRATGAPAIQVNTGKGCHLDAAMIAHAASHLALPENGVLFIENVGNLVCPAGFDLGEAHKVVVCSVTEGEDKPLKYPNMYAASDLMVVTKTDLAPHCDVDVDALIANARRINPKIGALKLSTRTGEGMDAWLAWLEAARAMRAVAG
ncbi:MAG: hydrogenase nickel incorporation protein HypB [Rhizobiaceae bacterium]|nr:hydrogenase nickel incorporation protein HypB [Rhizobiaceae bacterium]